MNAKSKHAIAAKAVENALRPAMYAKGKPIAAMNILDRMKYYHVPGVSVAVIDNGKIDWAKGYGIKETGGNDPVTPETLFQAASISKPVTALGTLQLVEKGSLDLDSPVNDKLVSWKVPENEFSEKEKVTLRQLLTHSAGLTVSGFPGYATSEQIPTPVQVLDGEKPANTHPVRIDMIPRISVALLRGWDSWLRNCSWRTCQAGLFRNTCRQLFWPPWE